MTRSRSSSRTFGSLLMTRETVFIDTSATRATSMMVGFLSPAFIPSRTPVVCAGRPYDSFREMIAFASAGVPKARREENLVQAMQPGGLTRGQRYGFAVGDFGFNLFWQGLGLFLVYFQTDVLGLPATWAGAAYLAVSLWDCLNDPVMGVIADRT